MDAPRTHWWLDDLRIGPDTVGETMDAQVVTANVPKDFYGNAPCTGSATAPTSTFVTLATPASPSEFPYSNKIAEAHSIVVPVTC